MLESFLPHHSISAEDTLPLNKSKIFTVSLKLNALTFILILGIICFLGGIFSQNKWQQNTQQMTQ
jgi:hypothetical protein